MHQNYNLIRVTTADHLYLNGLYREGDKTKAAVILIHGFTGDFYSHDFYHVISDKLTENRNALILAQNRGTGLHTEFIKDNGGFAYLGSFYEKIEDAHLDISAYIEFLVNEGYEQIVLVGHSLGTIKVVRYLFEGQHKDKVAKLVLLAPFDKNVFMEMKAGNDWDNFLKNAKDKIDSGKGQEIVPVPEYEDYPVTYETFYSWYNKTDLNRIWDFYKQPYEETLISQLSLPVKVILGSEDEYTTYPSYHETPESVLKTLNEKIQNCETHLLAHAGHSFKGHEAELANEVVKFL